ncbi:MAG: Gfo/Idh/MocA family oxidoreductase [Sedimentisphaerales bacterium]|nr:Gfo/Idh/MocA family oxidoreductase [Sedimentisphaerales bacterium]
MHNREFRPTRREWLKTSLAAVTLPYIIRSTSFAQGNRPAPSDRITLGAIGVGGRGRGDLQGLMNDARIQAVAVCDVQAKNCQTAVRIVNDFYAKQGQPNGCREYTDFRELLARQDIDAVLIATPDHWHAIPAIQACASGKAVYCEKPLALTIEQGQKMVQAARRYGVVFQTGTQQRSEERFRRACELVRNGRVGKIHTIEVEVPGSMQTDRYDYGPVPEGLDYEMWLGPAPFAPYSPLRIDPFGWRWIFDYAGGCVTDWGAHHMDIAQWAMGTTGTGPTEIEGKGVFPKRGLFNTAIHWRYEARYANGVKVICFAKEEFKHQYPNGIHFLGDKGELFVNRDEIRSNPESILKEQIGPEEIQLYKSDDHYRNFVDGIVSKKPVAAPVNEAHRSVTVCHLANIAMRLERMIRWDPDRERIVGDDEAQRMLSRPMRSPWRL